MNKRQVVLYIFLMLILLTTSVYATLNAELDVKITADDEIYYPGEEFIVTLALKDLNTTDGVKYIEGYIDIEDDIIEPLTVDSIIKDENGKVKILNDELEVYSDNSTPVGVNSYISFNKHSVENEGDYKLVFNLENKIMTDVDLIQLKFKINSGISAGVYQKMMSYKLFGITPTSSDQKVLLDQKDYGIKITERASNENIVNNIVSQNNTAVENKPENRPQNKAINNVSNNVIKNSLQNKIDNKNKIDNTVSPTKLPETGNRLIWLPISAIVIVGLVFYKKYSNYSKRDD